jgi:hypothetical protein
MPPFAWLSPIKIRIFGYLSPTLIAFSLQECRSTRPFSLWTGASRLKYERPVAWGTTGLPYEPAWVWGIEALGCVGRGFDERLGRPPTGYLNLVAPHSEARFSNILPALDLNCKHKLANLIAQF